MSAVPIDTNVILGIVLAILYAVSGAIEAIQKGEKIDWVTFGKTIVLVLVSYGFLDQLTGDSVIQMLGIPIVTLFLDKIVNALINKWKRTQPQPVPPPTS